MKLRFPLYAQLLTWFFLNLVLLAAGFYLLLNSQFHFKLDTLLSGPAGERIEAIASVVEAEMAENPPAQWTQVLARFQSGYGLDFYAFNGEGIQVAGQSVALPADVSAKLHEVRGRPGIPIPPSPGQPPPPRGGRPGMAGQRGGRPKFLVRAGNPIRYWIGVRMPLPGGEDRRRGEPGFLLAASDSMGGGGLLFDVKPLVISGFAAVLLSVIFWGFLVRSLTRKLAQMTRATEQIAEGHFDVVVAATRNDELGQLGQAINRMSTRLEGFVTGQKRFLGDIAHELCSPLARMQMALGILEQRADAKQTEYVQDVREEVQEMSELVNELLSFSKAGLKARDIPLQSVPLRAVIDAVIQKEAPEDCLVEVPADLAVLAEPELLSRAIANLVRNAVRYAGTAGPIEIKSSATPDQVTLIIQDSGPGVPEAALARLSEPFFRPDTARTREQGGAGLGLAIVRSCVDACQGTLSIQNRKPNGLTVSLTLKTAPFRQNRSLS